MQLMIVESPNKIKKIKSFLDDNWIILASFGHIRDLKKKELAIEIDNNFNPLYQVLSDKKKVIDELKKAYKKCDSVWLASDLDYEGEAIAYHLVHVLGLKENQYHRITFNEITKKAILDAINNPKKIDMNKFYAQQSRRILDRLIGFIISPCLWNQIQSSYKKKVSLSAGRVQSVVLKVIIERENEIQKFKSNVYFSVSGYFYLKENNKVEIVGKLNTDINTEKELNIFLQNCQKSIFKIEKVKKWNSVKRPSAPFITSTLQQEASNKLYFSPKKTMLLAQKLYESGYITYMRTDSTALSQNAMKKIKKEIISRFGEGYYYEKQYKNKLSNVQGAHECCRPCKLSYDRLKGDCELGSDANRLYELIWKRTIASQMNPAKLEVINLHISMFCNNSIAKTYFNAKTEKVLFDGFQKVYNIVIKENEHFKNIKKGDILNYNTIIGTEKITKPPHARYSEASLVKKMEKLGIGRPSTYSNMVSIVQDRKYVVKKSLDGKEKKYNIFMIKKNHKNIINEKKTMLTQVEKNKLFPTDIGNIVNDFLQKYFSNIFCYDFTSDIEKKLDKIANGNENWINIVGDVYKLLGKAKKLNKSKNKEKDKYKRFLGKDSNNNSIYVYIGKYGPVAQLEYTYKNKKICKFAPLGNYKIIDITLKEALELFKYPQKLGKYESKEITICNGKYGLYLKYDGKNYSTYGKHLNLQEAIDLIKNKGKSSNILRKIDKNIIIKNMESIYLIKIKQM